MKLLNANAWKLLVAWIVILSILYSTLSVIRHNHFQSGGFDLGLYDQAVWQYSRFQYPFNTIKDRFILGDHLTLTLPLLAPLFWMWNDVRMLLIFQAIWVSFSILAVYKLVFLRKFSPFVALCISIIYSLFYGIQYGIFFDFHPVLLATGLIPWMLYFLESKKTKLFFISLALLLLTQENMGFAVVSLGFIYFFRNKKMGIAFIIGGIAASFVCMKVINLFFPFQYMPQIIWNPAEFFNSPEKQQVWLYTLSAFSFLPIFSPGALLAIGFDLAQYFITGPEFNRMWSPYMHHRAILAPFVLLGTLDALQLLKKHTRMIVIFLIISALFQQYYFHFPLNKLAKPEFWKTETWETDNQKMLSTIPKDVPVVTQQSLVPHLSHRNQIYIAWPRVHEPGWWLDFDKNAQYLLIDTHPGIWLTMLLETPARVTEALTNMEKAGKISLLKQINAIRLYKIDK